jgi:hypothetical protein
MGNIGNRQSIQSQPQLPTYDNPFDTPQPVSPKPDLDKRLFKSQLEAIFAKEIAQETSEDKTTVDLLVRTYMPTDIFADKYNFLNDANEQMNDYLFFALSVRQYHKLLLDYVGSKYFNKQDIKFLDIKNSNYLIHAIHYKQQQLATTILDKGGMDPAAIKQNLAILKMTTRLGWSKVLEKCVRILVDSNKYRLDIFNIEFDYLRNDTLQKGYLFKILLDYNSIQLLEEYLCSEYYKKEKEPFDYFAAITEMKQERLANIFLIKTDMQTNIELLKTAVRTRNIPLIETLVRAYIKAPEVKEDIFTIPITYQWTNDKGITHEYNDFLFVALLWYKTPVLEEYIRSSKCVPEKTPILLEYKGTYLQYCIRFNKAAIAKCLIENRKHNPGYVDANDETALIYAIYYKHSEIAISLIFDEEQDCKLAHISKKQGTSALRGVVEKRLEDLIPIVFPKLLPQMDTFMSLRYSTTNQYNVRSPEQNLFFELNEMGAAEMLEMYIDSKQFNPKKDNYTSTKGETYLISALRYKQPKLALKLVNAGHYFPWHKDLQNCHALDYAVEFNYKEIVEKMVSNECNYQTDTLERLIVYSLREKNYDLYEKVLMSIRTHYKNLTSCLNEDQYKNLTRNVLKYLIRMEDCIRLRKLLEMCTFEHEYLTKYYHATHKEVKQTLLECCDLPDPVFMREKGLLLIKAAVEAKDPAREEYLRKQQEKLEPAVVDKDPTKENYMKIMQTLEKSKDQPDNSPKG